MRTLEPQDAPTAYEVLAPAYELLSHASAYERWLSSLLGATAEHGFGRGRVLDVACGTGRSFAPLLRRGFDVVACDVSPAMVELARAAYGDAAAIHIADMRSLPSFGQFALVTCLNDAINHLTHRSEVASAFEGMRRNLTSGGLLAFDVNTLAGYAARADAIVEDGERLLAWRASRAAETKPGGTAAVLVDVFTRRADGAWDRMTSYQLHRHYALDDIERLLAAAGMDVVAVHGQRRGGQLDPSIDEERHPKALFLASPRTNHPR